MSDPRDDLATATMPQVLIGDVVTVESEATIMSTSWVTWTRSEGTWWGTVTNAAASGLRINADAPVSNPTILRRGTHV